MSISLYRSPNPVEFVKNDNLTKLSYVCSSTNSATSTRYEFTLNVYDNLTDTIKNFVLKTYSDPTVLQGSGTYINLQSIVKEYIQNIVDPFATTYQFTNQMVCYIVSKIRHYYISGQTYEDRNETTGNVQFLLDASLNYVDNSDYGNQYYYDKYVCTYTGSTALTEFETFYIDRNQVATLSFINGELRYGTGGQIRKMVYRVFVDPSNELNYTDYTLYNYYYTNSPYTSNVANTNKSLIVYPTGSKNLRDMKGITLSDCYYYDCWVENVSNQRISKKYRYYIKEPVSNKTIQQIYYKNKIGGWDFFNFYQGSDTTLKATKTYYTQSLFKMEGVDYSYKIGTPSKVNLSVNKSKSLKLYTDWINSNDCKRLEDLFFSPEMYIIDYTLSKKIPCYLTDGTFSTMDKDSEKYKAYQLNFDIEY